MGQVLHLKAKDSACVVRPFNVRLPRVYGYGVTVSGLILEWVQADTIKKIGKTDGEVVKVVTATFQLLAAWNCVRAPALSDGKALLGSAPAKLSHRSRFFGSARLPE